MACMPHAQKNDDTDLAVALAELSSSATHGSDAPHHDSDALFREITLAERLLHACRTAPVPSPTCRTALHVLWHHLKHGLRRAFRPQAAYEGDSEGCTNTLFREAEKRLREVRRQTCGLAHDRYGLVFDRRYLARKEISSVKTEAGEDGQKKRQRCQTRDVEHTARVQRLVSHEDFDHGSDKCKMEIGMPKDAFADDGGADSRRSRTAAGLRLETTTSHGNPLLWSCWVAHEAVKIAAELGENCPDSRPLHRSIKRKKASSGSHTIGRSTHGDLSSVKKEHIRRSRHWGSADGFVSACFAATGQEGQVDTETPVLAVSVAAGSPGASYSSSTGSTTAVIRSRSLESSSSSGGEGDVELTRVQLVSRPPNEENASVHGRQIWKTLAQSGVDKDVGIQVGVLSSETPSRPQSGSVSCEGTSITILSDEHTVCTASARLANSGCHSAKPPSLLERPIDYKERFDCMLNANGSPPENDLQCCPSSPFADAPSPRLAAAPIADASVVSFGGGFGSPGFRTQSPYFAARVGTASALETTETARDPALSPILTASLSQGTAKSKCAVITCKDAGRRDQGRKGQLPKIRVRLGCRKSCARPSVIVKKSNSQRVHISCDMALSNAWAQIPTEGTLAEALAELRAAATLKARYATRLAAAQRLFTALCATAAPNPEQKEPLPCGASGSDCEYEQAAPGLQVSDVVLELWRELQRALWNIGCKLHDRRDALTLIDVRRGVVALRRKIRAFAAESCGMDLARFPPRPGAEKPTDEEEFSLAAEAPPHSLDELRRRCPKFRATGSCRHLCAHLCYYREFEPARQLQGLRRRARAHPLQPSLLGWTAGLRLSSKSPFWSAVIYDALGTARGSLEAAWKHALDAALAAPLVPIGIDGCIRETCYFGSTSESSTRAPLTVAEIDPEVVSSGACGLDTRGLRLSPFGLIEELLQEDPWQLLTVCIMLNRAGRMMVDKVAAPFFEKWPTAEKLLECTANAAGMAKLESVLLPLGLQQRRARLVRCFSHKYLLALAECQGAAAAVPDPTVSDGHSGPRKCVLEPVPAEKLKSMPGMGKYSCDAYQIFCTTSGIDRVEPTDTYLGWFVERHRAQRGLLL